jgi:D-alanyl-D-alanine carboxypeptidase
MFMDIVNFSRSFTVALATLMAVGTVTPAIAAARPAGCDHRPTGQALDALVGAHHLPGAAVAVDDPSCGRWTDATGVADLRTRRPMRADERVRIGSTTKSFTATVLLQLVAEGRVSLDAPVERYLPGLIREHGYDGRTITVRQLLRHTSGLPDYVGTLGFEHFDEVRYRHYAPRDLIERALVLPRPKPGWSYANTNYIVLGLIAEKVTGRPLGDEITRRIIRPLRLHDTYWPGEDPRIHGAHPRGYLLIQGSRSTPATSTPPRCGPPGRWCRRSRT